MATIGSALAAIRTELTGFVAVEFKKLPDPKFGVIIQGAKDLYHAIDNAQVKWQYANVLSQPQEKVYAVQGHLTELTNMMRSLRSRETTAVSELSFRVQQFIKSLGLGDFLSRIDKTVPGTVFVIVDKDAYVSFHGLFTYAVKYKKAELHVNNNNYQLSKTSAPNRLDFNFGMGMLPEEALNKPHLVEGTLKVQFNQGHVSDIKWANYTVIIVTHPLSPGKITLTYPETVVKNVVQKHFRSANMTLSPRDFPAGAERCMVVKPTPGWKITGVPQIHSQGGAADVAADQFPADHVAVKLTLPAEGVELAQAYVEFDEQQDVMEEKTTVVDVKLKWGGTHDFKAKNGFKVVYESNIDGQKSEFTAVDRSNPYLTVTPLGDGYRLEARPFTIV